MKATIKFPPSEVEAIIRQRVSEVTAARRITKITGMLDYTQDGSAFYIGHEVELELEAETP
jgi:hypothetical protein